MKLGIVWNAVSEQAYQGAVDFFNAQRGAFKKQFEVIDVHRLSTREVPETLTAVFCFSQERGLDFCLLSHRSAWALDPVKLNALLVSEGIQKAAISVRAGRIVVKGATFSPKIPYLDEDFIIVNVKRCEELGIPEHLRAEDSPSAEGLSCGTWRSHFEDAGGIHATLLSFLEAVVPYGEVYIYSDGSDIQDIYGDFRGFALSPLYYSEKYGFLSADPDRDPRIHSLCDSFLSGRVRFLKKPMGQRIAAVVMQSIKRVLRGVNYEIQKKYDDKT